ncbi:MAG: hypothetical protein IJU65_11640 [Desulfovibrio sp.]|nr:hypothetical protein [Desulfovibrio sp.]
MRIVCSCIFFVCAVVASCFAHAGEYTRAACYFSDSWPVNFWNSEFAHLDQELEQIHNDGFDSIILVIPWREFQPDISPVSYNEYPFVRLDAIMRAAQRHGLGVWVRLGYIWDYYNDANDHILERYITIFQETPSRSAWLDYCKTLYASLSRHDNFRGGFLTWEDFWDLLYVCDIENKQHRVTFAKALGFQQFVRETYGLHGYNTFFATEYPSVEDIPIPRRSEAAMEAMFRFWDGKLSALLEECQAVFPGLSMEVRLDADAVANGKIIYHHSTWSCGNAAYTAAMYAIPMGFENKGERVSAEEALAHTKYILANIVKHNGGKPVFAEQFLFTDNVPAFSHNARIRANEVSSYLQKLAPVLRETTCGYGIWAYRDYEKNMLYNGQFALANKGWKNNGKPVFVDNTCRLRAGDAITQYIPHTRDYNNTTISTVHFDVVALQEQGTVTLNAGKQKMSILITNTGRYSVDLARAENFDFTISMTNGDITIDNVVMRSGVQEGKLYDVANRPLEHIEDIRLLNKKLSFGGENDAHVAPVVSTIR